VEVANDTTDYQKALVAFSQIKQSIDKINVQIT
jgi:hypothetical protein